MTRLFSATGARPPGEMPPIDPGSVETDETFAAIISRDDTGKLTVGRREPRRPSGGIEPPADAPPENPAGDRDGRPPRR